MSFSSPFQCASASMTGDDSIDELTWWPCHVCDHIEGSTVNGGVMTYSKYARHRPQGTWRTSKEEWWGERTKLIKEMHHRWYWTDTGSGTAFDMHWTGNVEEKNTDKLFNWTEKGRVLRTLSPWMAASSPDVLSLNSFSVPWNIITHYVTDISEVSQYLLPSQPASVHTPLI